MFANDVSIGGSVYWDVSGSHTDHHIVEAEVLGFDNDNVICIRRRTHHRGPDGPFVREISDFYEQPVSMRRSYFDVPVTDRVLETQEFWGEIAAAFAR